MSNNHLFAAEHFQLRHKPRIALRSAVCCGTGSTDHMEPVPATVRVQMCPDGRGKGKKIRQ